GATPGVSRQALRLTIGAESKHAHGGFGPCKGVILQQAAQDLLDTYPSQDKTSHRPCITRSARRIPARLTRLWACRRRIDRTKRQGIDGVRLSTGRGKGLSRGNGAGTLGLLQRNGSGDLRSDIQPDRELFAAGFTVSCHHQLKRIIDEASASRLAVSRP